MAKDPILRVYNLGILGVNRVLSPIHKIDGELLQGQNAIVIQTMGQKALAKRPGMRRLTPSPVVGDVLGAINLPFRPPPAPAGQTPPHFPGGGGATSMACGAYLTSDLAVTLDTATIVDLQDEQFDYGNMHDNVVNPSRITVPVGGAGIYLLMAQATWDPVPATRLFWLEILVNGVVRAHDVGGGNWNWPGEVVSHSAAVLMVLAAGDYVQMRVRWEGSFVGTWDLVNGIDKTFLQAVLVYVP